MDLLCFCSVLCLLCLCARLFICALWSPAGKGLTSWLSFVVSAVSLSLSHWYPGSGVVLIVSIPDLRTLTYFKLKISCPHPLREFSRHIRSPSEFQAASNKRCLHSVRWGATYVTISNMTKSKMKV